MTPASPGRSPLRRVPHTEGGGHPRQGGARDALGPTVEERACVVERCVGTEPLLPAFSQLYSSPSYSCAATSSSAPATNSNRFFAEKRR